MRQFRAGLLVAVVAVAFAGVPAAAGPPRGPVFEHGEAQPVFDPDRAVREDLFVSAPVDSDGDGHDDRAHVRVVRPRESGQGLRVPVVYQVSPYFAGGNDVPNHNVDTELYVPERAGRSSSESPRRDERITVATAKEISWAYERYLLARGYAVVYADSPGTGESTGCPSSGGENETIGAKSVVDWLNSRASAHTSDGAPAVADWASGKVGMMGVSYNGTLPNAVASTGVAGLEAIVPIGAISNWYDYYRSGGAVVAPDGYQGEDADVLAKYVYTRADREVCRARIDRIAAEEDRVTGDYNDFWDHRNYLNDVDRVHAAVLSVHGLHDWNVKTRQAAQWYEALRERGVPHKIWWHQSGHTDPITLRKDAWLHTLNRWFTRYLYGVPNGVEGEPRATIQREDSSWVEEPEWPAPEAHDVVLRPGKGGRTRGALGKSEVEGVESLWDDATRTAEELASAPESPNRLSYVTEPLAAPVRISGTVRAELGLTFDRPAANVTALLVDQAPDGSTSVVTRGWADPQNRHRLDRTSPVRPGRRYDIDVSMQPDDYVFAPGHQLGLVVLSSDHDFTLRPKPGTGLALDLSRTSMRLPLLGPIR